MILRSKRILGIRTNVKPVMSFKPQIRSQFPFFKLPPELCTRILKHLWQYEPWCFYYIRFVCRRMNKLIDKNKTNWTSSEDNNRRGILRRVIITQDDWFYRCKRFVATYPLGLSDHHVFYKYAYIEYMFFHKVTFRSNELKHMINSLDQNRMIINGMIFHGVNALTCAPQLIIDLLKTSRITSLIMIDCEIPVILAKWLERDFVPALDKYYIGSSHNFIKYGDNSILRDDWLTALLEKMHGNVSVDEDDEFLSLGIPHRYCNLGSYEDQDEITKRYIAHLIKIQKNAY